jgi:hypothetical protein
MPMVFVPVPPVRQGRLGGSPIHGVPALRVVSGHRTEPLFGAATWVLSLMSAELADLRGKTAVQRSLNADERIQRTVRNSGSQPEHLRARLLEPPLAQVMHLAGAEDVGVGGVVVVDEPAEADGS